MNLQKPHRRGPWAVWGLVGISLEPRTQPGTAHTYASPLRVLPTRVCTWELLEVRWQPRLPQPLSVSSGCEPDSLPLKPLLFPLVQNHSLSQHNGAFQTPSRSQLSLPPQHCPFLPQARPLTVVPMSLRAARFSDWSHPPASHPSGQRKGASQPPQMAPGDTGAGGGGVRPLDPLL